MGEEKKGWDLTSANSVTAAAEWIRKRSGALLVLVVRPEDVAFAVDGQVAPASALDLVNEVMPGAMEHLRAARSR